MGSSRRVSTLGHDQETKVCRCRDCAQLVDEDNQLIETHQKRKPQHVFELPLGCAMYRRAEIVPAYGNFDVRELTHTPKEFLHAIHTK
jgi:hypothetical protein